MTRTRIAAIVAAAIAAFQVTAAIDRTNVVALISDKATEILVAVARAFGLPL